MFKGTGGIEYGPTFTTDDVVGCCVNFRTNTVFYTKNGLPLGVAFKGILNEPLHPAIGLRTPGEIVEANFGQKPFVFDFQHYLEVIYFFSLFFYFYYFFYLFKLFLCKSTKINTILFFFFTNKSSKGKQ